MTMKGVTQELESLGKTLQDAFGVIGQVALSFTLEMPILTPSAEPIRCFVRGPDGLTCTSILVLFLTPLFVHISRSVPPIPVRLHRSIHRSRSFVRTCTAFVLVAYQHMTLTMYTTCSMFVPVSTRRLGKLQVAALSTRSEIGPPKCSPVMVYLLFEYRRRAETNRVQLLLQLRSRRSLLPVDVMSSSVFRRRKAWGPSD
jgi:hypothetical protein